MIKYNEPIKYKQMCEIFNEEQAKGSKGRQLQLRKWQQYYDIEKIGTNYFIKRKYDEPLIRQSSKYYKQFDYIDKFNYNCGIYKVELNNSIYIGQTKDFKSRFYSHINSKKSRAKNLLLNGAMLEPIEYIENRKDRLTRETYWTKYYKDLGYNILNSESVLCKKKKNEYKQIKILKENYNKAIELLKENNLL